MSTTRLTDLLDALDLDVDTSAADIEGRDPVLPCRYPLGEAAAAVAAATGLAVARIGELRGIGAQRVVVDVAHAAAGLRGFLDQVLDGVILDPDPTGKLPLVGLFATRDGQWVQTYGVFSPLLDRTRAVLGVEPGAPREAVAAAVARRDSAELVDALVAAGVPGAAVASRHEWLASAHGQVLARRPVVAVERIGDAPRQPFAALTSSTSAPRPLAGLRVLDVTRILAGPVTGRTLAEHGADVLQLTNPALPSVSRAMLDTSPGKRSAHLDLRTPQGRRIFESLVAGSDVVTSNARPGALARRGLGPLDLARLRPGLVCVEADCFGFGGPWSPRPGFEPIAQAATGWADEHRDRDGTPTIVPVLASDYLTGGFGALGALIALLRRAEQGGSWLVRVSLCHTAQWLAAQPGPSLDPALATHSTAEDFRMTMSTAWGEVRQLAPLARLSLTPPYWATAAVRPGTHAPTWQVTT